MSGINILRRLLMKQAVKDTANMGSGIMTINRSLRSLVDKDVDNFIMSAQKQGVDLDKLGEQELKYILEMNKPKPPKVIAADSPEGKGITEALLGKKGQVIEADFGKPFSEEIKNVQKRIDSGVAATVEKMLNMTPMDAMKEANSVIGRRGMYKNLSADDAKKILQDTEDHIFERNIDIDPQDFAGGGVAGMLGERPGYREGGPGQLGQRGKKRIKPTDYYTDKIIRDNIGRIENDLLFKYILPDQRDKFFENIKPEDMYTTFDEKDGYSGLMYEGLDNPPDKGVSALGLLEILKEPGGVDKDYDVRDRKPFDRDTRFYFDDEKGFVEGYELKDGGRPGYNRGSLVKKFIQKFITKDKDFSPKEFVDRRNFFMNIIGQSEKQKNKRMLEDILGDNEKLKAKPSNIFPSDDEIRLELEKRLQPILNKNRKLNADGGRQNFKLGRRAFLKMLAGTGAGIAGLKTGITGLGGKKVATEVAKEAVTTSGGTPPPYFFNLVKKIKNLGDDVTSKSATTERQKVTKYKDYELTEDLTTGEQTIQKKSFADPDEGFTYENKTEEVYMNYKPGKGQADEATGKVADEYVEDTSYVGTSRGDKGEIVDTVDGVPDEVIQEGTMFEDDITDFATKKVRTKKAGGGVAYMLGQ